MFRLSFQLINSHRVEGFADENVAIHLQNCLIHFIHLILDCNRYTTNLLLLEREFNFPSFVEVLPLITPEFENIQDLILESKI